MKKLILFVLTIAFAVNLYGQANVIQTPNFKFRTIKKGYSGDWIGSQTDTTGNGGLNYNALMNELLWSKVFNSSYWIQTTFRDSILKNIPNDTASWNTAATRAGKIVADTTKWNNAVPTYKELIGFITQTGTSAPSIGVISSTYVHAPTFTYQGVGNYQCLTGTFEAELTNNTIIMIQPATDQGTPPIRPKIYANSNYDQNGTYLYITTYDTLNAVHNDQLLYGSTVIIRSYP